LVIAERPFLYYPWQRKGRVSLLCILLGLALSAQAIVAPADTNHAPLSPHKNSVKKYMKGRQKMGKKARKMQNKAVKSWKTRHHTA
jgi:hypothetical protein